MPGGRFGDFLKDKSRQSGSDVEERGGLGGVAGGCQGLIKVRGVHSYANRLELREVSRENISI